MSVNLTAFRLPRLSYKQKVNQERKEGGQPKFLTRHKRRHRDPKTPAHKSRITKNTSTNSVLGCEESETIIEKGEGITQLTPLGFHV